MNSPINKTDISWIVQKTVIGNALFMFGSVVFLILLHPTPSDLIYLSLCSIIGFAAVFVIIYAMIFKTIGEKIHPVYLVTAIIEAASILFLSLYLYGL